MDISLKQIVLILGGWSIVLVGVSTFIGRLLSERMFSKWRRDEQRELEKLRNDLGTDRLLLEGAAKSFQMSQDAYHQKRLAAVGNLWSAVIQLRKDFSQPVFFFSILLPNEYEQQLRPGNLGDILSDLTFESIGRKIESLADLENERPFLGETLWLQFFTYRAFLGRLAALIVDKKKQNNISHDWRSDSGIQQILGWVLTSKEVSTLTQSKEVTDMNRIINSLEGQILLEMSLITSGKRSSSESFENAALLKNAVATINPANLIQHS